MKTWYILYYYPPYRMSWTKTYVKEIQATTENQARIIFKHNEPKAVIKGIEDYEPC